MNPKIVGRPSPNQDERPEGTAIDMLILHYTGMRTAEEALARLCDPAARVSAHYTIDRDGTVYAHVPEDRRAWHAGISYWSGERNVNARSIGIELVNPGHEFGYIPFAEPQIAALIELGLGILKRHAIPAARVLGHSDVAPNRKEDPGELFPWKTLAEVGIGLWPDASAHFGKSLDRTEAGLASALARFGYGVPPDVDWPLADVVRAFQRHFRPSCINGIADPECADILDALLSS
ncbi:MAG TPA: N-acetylmuramoyl-L-alanine amidase [Rhizomicrobium sp.]|nr:N-acetylmuramoyl-L-alanine amidase [Rhizomicrobium sp.]